MENEIENLTHQLEKSPELWPSLISTFASAAGLSVRREADGDVVLVHKNGRKAIGYTGKQFRFEETDLQKPAFVPGAGIRGDARKVTTHLTAFVGRD
jgi:hypothetical protein